MYSCPPSSSKSESDGRPGEAVNRLDHSIPGHMPYNWKSSNLNLPPEQLKALEVDLEVLSAEFGDQIAKYRRENQSIKECGTQANPKSNFGSSLSQPWKVSTTCMKNDQDPKLQESIAVNSNNLPKVSNNKDVGDFWYAYDHLMDLDYFKLSSEQPEKLGTDMTSGWTGTENTVPWWQTADKNELASLVYHKSLENMENCDLPRPQTKNFGRAVAACPQNFYHRKIVNLSSDQMADKGISNVADYAQGSPASVSMDDAQCTRCDVVGSSHVLNRLFRSTSFSNNGSNTTTMEKEETLQRPWTDLSETQLLEALCHSQTRAREAEKAAQEAYNEKEHIVTLFFRQASHLFAYRQWLQILQLENLCLQLKNKDQPTSIRFLPFLPWVSSKGWRTRKGRHKAAKRKRPPPRNKICKSAVAFAVGFGLAGAGLFLGWTMGWFFPPL